MNSARFRGIAGGLTALALLFPQGAWAQADLADQVKKLEAKVEDLKKQQEEAAPIVKFFKSTQLTGYVDTYFAINGNRPADMSIGLRGVNTNHGSLQFNAAKLSFNRPTSGPDTIGYRLDLVYGPAADSFLTPFEPANPVPAPGGATTQGDFSTQRNILNAYVSYSLPAGKGLNLDFGKYTTFIGAEGFDTFDNWNYQQGVMFAFAQPYYHTGLRATYAASDKVGLGFYVVNGWNNSFDSNTGKSFGASATITPNSKWNVSQNFLSGPENGTSNTGWRHLYDGVVNTTLSEKLALRFNYDVGSNSPVGGGPAMKWYGIASSARLTGKGGKAALAIRYEYLRDDAGFTTGTIQDLKTFTVTNEYKVKSNLSTKIEYRYDYSNEAVFKKLAGPNDQNQNVFLVGLVAAFGVGKD